jgi:hypothetical protein
VQESLGRDATAVKAGAAELVFLDEGYRLAQLCGTQCSSVTAAAATENYYVEIVVSHEICSKQ